MIVAFHDGSTVTVSDARGEAIKAAIRSGVEFIDIDDDMYTVSGIKAVKSSSVSKAKLPENKQLAAPTTELSEDRRLANLERLRTMRTVFLRHRAKEASQDG